MEVNTYYKYLLQLLNKEEVIDDKEEEELLKINIYLSLLSLNNHNYKDKIYEEEFLIIDNFLRRVNNYKVKIQLKRKDTEIEEILKEINLLYEENKKIIDKYNIYYFFSSKVIFFIIILFPHLNFCHLIY